MIVGKIRIRYIMHIIVHIHTYIITHIYIIIIAQTRIVHDIFIIISI